MTDPESGWEEKEDSFDISGDDTANDLFYTVALLDHLEKSFCIDLRRIYATGLGQGAGVVHQLACHTHLSRRIAAFAPVNGAFYRPVSPEDLLWARCMIGRRPIPMLEIHGAENQHYPLLPLADNSISLATISSDEWVKDWAQLNKCGDVVGQSSPSTATRAVQLTELTTGQRSESIVFGGLVTKTAYRCGFYSNRQNSDLNAEEKDPRKLSIVHYAVKNFGHGWPRVKAKAVDSIHFNGHDVKPLGSPNFDASAVVLNFFRAHRLPSQSTIHGQAKQLLIERGAKVYKDGPEARYHREL